MLVSITGPSGIGKGFVKQLLFDRLKNIEELTWTTTRLKRSHDETNRKSVSTDDFQKMEEAGELILIQDLYGHRYGLERRLLVDRPNQIMFTELHIENLMALTTLGISPVAIGLIPSSMEFLRKRLTSYRGTESPTEIEARLQAAQSEVQQIFDNRHLFLAVIEIAEATEKNVAQEVLNTLTPHLKGGLGHEP